jgi:ribosomal protein S18 acetylase RimI-like enzyme
VPLILAAVDATGSAQSEEEAGYETREFREDDTPQVVALLQDAFGTWPGAERAASDSPEAFFRWKHIENPTSPSAIVVAETPDHQIIGVRAYMVWPMLVSGEPVTTTQVVDLATHPAHQRQGVGTALIMKIFEIYGHHKPVNLGLPNAASLSQSENAGWRPVGRVPVWGRARRPLRILRARGARGEQPADGPAPPVEAATAAEGLRDGEAIAGLLEESRMPVEGFVTERSLEELRWRYQPMLAHHWVLTEERGGELKGLVVFRLHRRGPLWGMSVCDLVARPGDTRTVGRLLRRVSAAAPVDYVAAVPSDPSTPPGALRRAGFLPSPIGSSRRLGVQTIRELPVDPYDLSRWKLTLGDLERLQLC